MRRSTNAAFFRQRRRTCKGLLSFGVGLAGCGGGGGSSSAGTTMASMTAATTASQEPIEVLSLPAPRTDGAVSIESVLAMRRSIREWTSEPLSMEELGQLAWAAQGITDPSGKRTAPSAGALYPLELYLLTADGVLRYLPDGHRLALLSTDDIRTEVPAQDFVGQAAATFVIAAVFARTEQRYGENAERYVHLEAGHAAHGILLQAVALGLGAVPIGAFDASALQDLVGMPEDHAPIYLVPLGTPA